MWHPIVVPPVSVTHVSLSPSLVQGALLPQVPNGYGDISSQRKEWTSNGLSSLLISFTGRVRKISEVISPIVIIAGVKFSCYVLFSVPSQLLRFSKSGVLRLILKCKQDKFRSIFFSWLV